MRTLFACCVGAVTGWLIGVGIQKYRIHKYRIHKLNKELEELEKNKELYAECAEVLAEATNLMGFETTVDDNMRFFVRTSLARWGITDPDLVEKTVQSVTGKSKQHGESNRQELLDGTFDSTLSEEGTV